MRCASSSDVQPDAEVTVECAPGTLAPGGARELAALRRESREPGSAVVCGSEAAAVGRLHKRSTVLEDIARLRAAGIANINIDLIAGLAAPDRGELAVVAGGDASRPARRM